MSNLSAFGYIQERSQATPGLFNLPLSIISANIAALDSGLTSSSPSGNTFSFLTNIETSGGAHFQFLSVGSTPPSYVTTAAITVKVNSAYSDYLYFADSSAQKSSYIIGSRAGNLADGLNIWDASAGTMIASFSKQSIRFFQNVVGPVFDTGGALASTYNAATFIGSGSSLSGLQAAINQASIDGVHRVYVPASMYPYDASKISFIHSLLMVREGGDWSVCDVKAYGAFGNDNANDSAAFIAAISAATVTGTNVVRVSATTNAYRIISTLTLWPNLIVRGEAGYSPQVRLVSTTTCPLFAFLGTSEAQLLNASLERLTLNGAGNNGNRNDVALRLRNFSHFFLRQVSFSNWSECVWADWGQDLYIRECNLSNASFGVKVGGIGAAGGIRSGNTDFFDGLYIYDTTFSQNAVDISHKGSHWAHGEMVLQGSTFFEAYPGSVLGKTHFVRIAGLKSVAIVGNRWESPMSRACLTLEATDTDGVSQGTVVGGIISGNGFILNGGSGTTGIWLKNATQINAMGNTFDVPNNSGAFAYDNPDPTQSNFVGLSAYSGLLSSGVGYTSFSWAPMRITDGSNTTPAISFSSEASLGIWRSSNSNLQIGMGGGQNIWLRADLGVGIGGQPLAARFQVYGTSLLQNNVDITGYSRVSDGDATSPMMGFRNEGALGWYRSGASRLGLSYGQISIPDGSSVTPSLGFSSNSSLGLYASGVQTIAQSYGTFDLTAAIASLGTIRVKSGANNSCGTAVLGSNGSVNVANTYIKTGDLIFLTDQTAGGTLGDLEIGGIRNSSGFTILSTSVTDTSTVAYLIIRPG